MKILILALALTTATPAAAAPWGYRDIALDVQAQKSRGERQDEERGYRGRDSRPDRHGEREERRERLSEDERRALHRDLDKANRELYRRR